MNRLPLHETVYMKVINMIAKATRQKWVNDVWFNLHKDQK